MATQALTSPAIVVARPSWSRYAASFNGRIGLLVLVLVPAEIFLARRLRSLRPVAVHTSNWRIFAILLCLLWYFHSVQSPRLIDSCELAIWGKVLISVLSLLIQIAGRSPYPLADRQLGRNRRSNALPDGIHRPHRRSASAPRHRPRQRLHHGADTSSSVQSWFRHSADIPSRRGDSSLALVLASLITVILFIFIPAAGPWITQPLPAHPQTGRSHRLPRPPQVTLALSASIQSTTESSPSPRSTSSTRFSPPLRLAPSAGFAFPSWIFATLICISTITTGWHYGINVLAGIILSIIVIWLARQIEPDGCPAQHSH